MSSYWLFPTPLLDMLLFLYPAYCSAAALKENNQEKIIQLMTYWIVFGVFATVESFLLFFLRYVPLYGTVRRAFCIWCVIPIDRNGGTIIYHSVIEQVFAEVQVEVQDLSHLSVEHVHRAAGSLRKIAKRGNQDIGESSGPTPGGLQELQDKTEAYRDKVMDQLLHSLSGASIFKPREAFGQEVVVMCPVAPKAQPPPDVAAVTTRYAPTGDELSARRRSDSSGKYFTDDDDSIFGENYDDAEDDSATGDDVTWSRC